MLKWKADDVEFFVPQLTAMLMTRGFPSRNVHVRVIVTNEKTNEEGYY